MDKPLISSEQVSALQAAFAGGALSLLFQGKITWWRTLLIFSSGEICAFYGTSPLAAAMGWNQGVIGLTIGFAAMFICTAGVNGLTAISNQPLRFLRSIPIVRALLGRENEHDNDVPD